MEIEKQLVEILSKKRYTIATAESCTGGMVAAKIINSPGASSVFNEGYITYSNEAKNRILKVEDTILEKYGAVSEQCAKQMAEGCRDNAKADIGIATTGIAGPDGGTENKPVGLVFLACAIEGETFVEKHIFKGSRNDVRQQAVRRVIEMSIEKIT